MMRVSRRAGLTMMLGAPLLASPSLLHAQDTIAATQPAPLDAGAAVTTDVQGEIVVTGQKRSENVQDVPKQVAVASQAQLASAGIQKLNDLQNAFPTITATQNAPGGSPRPPGIRGIAPFTFSVGVQSLTGIVVDDVPQATFSTLPFELADVERVEVFAGPQTTLSGRNSSAGLINIVTRSPSHTPQLDFSAERTTDGQTRGTIFVTGPITSNMAFSVSSLLNYWGGPYRNALNRNDRVEGFQTLGIRGKLLWEPTADLKTTLTGYYLHTDRDTIPVLGAGSIVAGPANGYFSRDALQRPLTTIFPGIQINGDNRSVYAVTEGHAETKDRGGTFRADLNVGQVGTASSITSYTISNQPRDDVFIGTPRDSLTSNFTNFNAVSDIQSKNFTQELRLTSPGDGPFTYLLGGIYSRIRLHQLYVRPQVLPFSGNQFVDTDSLAVFARGTYDLTPRDTLTAGLRYQNDKLGYLWYVLTAGSTISQGNDRYGFWGGEASYKHRFGERINAYITYSRAETGHAYDLNDTVTASTGASLPIIPSTKVQNWEAGVKSQLFDRLLTLNLDVFRARYRNFQAQDTRIDGNSIISRTLAVGRVVTQGVEAEAILRPSRDFALTVNAAYIDAKVADYPNAPCYVGQVAATGCITVAPGVTNQGNVRGNRLPYSSKWRVSGNADYTFHLSSVDMNVGAFYRYQSASTSDLFGDPLRAQKGYGVVNIHAGPRDPKGHWSLEVFVNNLFDKRYYSSLARTQSFIPFNGNNPVIFALYDRNSFRYGGLRATIGF